MNYGGMRVAELKELCLERGIALKSNMKKAEYVNLLEENDKSTVVEVDAEVIEEESSEIIPKFTINYQVGKIDVDFSELKQRVLDFKEQYRDFNPNPNDENEIESVKSNRLYVSEQRKLFKEKTKAVIDSYAVPLNEFKQEVNEVNELLEESYRLFKDVEDSVAESQRQYVKKELEESYIAFAGVIANTLPFDTVCEQKWLNKSFGFKKAEKELEAKVKSIIDDWCTLKTLDLPYMTEAEGHFFKNLSLNDAIAYAHKLEEDNRRITELRTQVGEIQYREDQEESTVRVERIVRNPIPITKVKSQDKPSQWVMLVDSATSEQCQAIGKFCGSLGVTGKFIKGYVPEDYVRNFIHRNEGRIIYDGQ